MVGQTGKRDRRIDTVETVDDFLVGDEQAVADGVEVDAGDLLTAAVPVGLKSRNPSLDYLHHCYKKSPLMQGVIGVALSKGRGGGHLLSLRLPY